MADLTKLAEGRECTIRIDGVCNRNAETTVLAHIRMAGISGAGLKAPDLLGAFACFDCHDAVDRRRYLNLDREFTQLCHLRGVMRTQAILIAEGRVKW